MTDTNKALVGTVRNLRETGMPFEEIERKLGSMISAAVALVRAEEATASGAPVPEPKAERALPPETSVPVREYVRPHSSGSGVLDRMPVLAQ